MDDEHFDDLLRDKLSDYEDPVYDPSSLAGLRERITSSIPRPWYAQRPSSSMVLSSLILFTLINGALLYYSFQGGVEQAAPPDVSSKNSSTIDSLYQVVTQLQGQVAELQSSAKAHTNKNHVTASSSRDVHWPQHPGKDFSAKTDGNFLENGLLPEGHPGTSTLKDTLANRRPVTNYSIKPDTVLLATPVLFYAKQETARLSDSIGPLEGKTSLSQQKAIEKNYYHGIGIALGPHLDLEDGIFSRGSGRIAPRLGVTSDWILSPAISMELGADYQSLVNRVNDNTINFQDPETAQYGPPQSVRMIANLASAPFALKYRTWVSARNQLVVKAGATPYFNLKGETQYTYLYSNGGPDNDVIQLTTVDHDGQRPYFGTTLTAAIGLTSKRKKNHDTFETSLFYERSVGSTGFNGERIQLAGIRTGYWFHLR